MTPIIGLTGGIGSGKSFVAARFAELGIRVVDADEATQIARASARDGSDVEQIKSIIASQMPRAEKLKKADFVIDNSGSREATERQVAEIDRGLRG